MRYEIYLTTHKCRRLNIKVKFNSLFYCSIFLVMFIFGFQAMELADDQLYYLRYFDQPNNVCRLNIVVFYCFCECRLADVYL